MPPYIFGIKPPILSLMITLFSSTKFPDFFSVYIIYPLNAMSNSKFAELRVQKSAPWLRQKKNADILGAWWGIAYKSRCRFLHLDLGNTEVVPWDLGDCRCQGLSGCRKLHVDIVNSLTITHRIQVLPYMVTFTINIHQMLAYIPYMDPMGYIIPWFFPQWIRGPSFEI